MSGSPIDGNSLDVDNQRMGIVGMNDALCFWSGPTSAKRDGMIHSVEIENFKNIRHQKIDLERLTVFVGPNGCGKTSVLQAIHRAVQSVVTGFSHQDTWWQDRRSVWAQSLDWLATRGVSGEMTLRFTTPAGKFSVTLLPIDVIPSNANETYNRVWMPDVKMPGGFARTVETDAAFHLLAIRLDASKLAEPSYSDRSPPMMGSDGNGLPSVLAYMALNDPDWFETLVDELRSLIPQIRRLRFTKLPVTREETELVRFGSESIERRLTREFQGDAILIDYQNAKGVMAQTVSEGTMLLLGLLTVLLGPDAPDVLLLDDIEHGLHPLAQKTLLETLTAIMERFPNLQILATAHSPYLLDCLQPEQVRLMTIGSDGYSLCGKLTDHPEFGKWKDEMAPGELWSLFGEKWLAEASATP